MSIKKNLKKIAAISMLAGVAASAKSNASVLDWLEKGVAYGVGADAIFHVLKGESLINKGLKAIGHSKGLLNEKDATPVAPQ